MANETKLNTIIQLRADTTEHWNNSQVKLLSGEMGLEYCTDGTVKIKAGKTVKVDGKEEGTLWKDLNYVGSDVKDAQVFQMTTPADYDSTKTDNELIADLVGSTEIQAGDIAIIKKYIDKPIDENASSTKISYTSYVYEKIETVVENEKVTTFVWQAMDGNYSADNVYLKNSITITKPTGYYGSNRTIDAGTSIESFLKDMLSQRELPKETKSPSVSLTVKNNGTTISKDTTYEIGTYIVPSFEATFNDGQYTAGTITKNTNATVNTWTITQYGTIYDIDGKVITKTTSSERTGSFDSFYIGSNTEYYIKATANHDNGTNITDNFGDAAAFSFASNSKEATSKKIKGARAWFYGYRNGTNALTSINNKTITSTFVRNNLTISLGALPSTMNIDKMKQIIIATPKDVVKSIALKDSKTGAPQTFGETFTISIDSANGYDSAEYDIWFVSNTAAAAGSATLEITVTK